LKEGEEEIEYTADSTRDGVDVPWSLEVEKWHRDTK
jgi:hypothetical protein